MQPAMLVYISSIPERRMLARGTWLPCVVATIASASGEALASYAKFRRLISHLESAEFSAVSDLLLTRVARGTGRQQPFYHPLGDFLADRSNFGTIAKFAITPEAARNIGISASGSAEKAVLSKMLAKQPTRGEEQHRLELCCICNLT